MRDEFIRFLIAIVHRNGGVLRLTEPELAAVSGEQALWADPLMNGGVTLEVISREECKRRQSRREEAPHAP